MAEKCCCEQCAHRRRLDAEVIEGYRKDKIRLAHEVDRLRRENAELFGDLSRSLDSALSSMEAANV